MTQQPNTREVKLVPIGDFQGIRIPKSLIDRYGWSESVLLEELEESIVLRGKEPGKLSWEETYRAMATEGEDWSDWEATVSDGLD